MAVIRIIRLASGLGSAEKLAQIAKILRRNAIEGSKDYAVREKAIEIVQRAKVPAKDYLGEAKAIQLWVQDNIRYTKDTYRREVFTSPHRLLMNLQGRGRAEGDCDDQAVLTAALLMGIGHRSRLILTDSIKDGKYSHIFAEAFIGKWIPVETTKRVALGWHPPHTKRGIIQL